MRGSRDGGSGAGPQYKQYHHVIVQKKWDWFWVEKLVSSPSFSVNSVTTYFDVGSSASWEAQTPVTASFGRPWHLNHKLPSCHQPLPTTLP